MTRKSSEFAERHSLTIRSKIVSTRVVEVTNNSLIVEINDKGTITGRYNAIQWGTIENAMNQDGTSTWNGKFMQVTNKGDVIGVTGSGAGELPDPVTPITSP